LDLEEQIQLYCLRLIKKIVLIIFVLFLFFSLFYFIHIKNFYNNEKVIIIQKGENLRNISTLILNDFSSLEKYIFYQYLKFWNIFIDNIDYGKFKLEQKTNLFEITKIISKPSNVLEKISIIDGWQEYQLDQLIKEKFGIDGWKKYQLLKDNIFYHNILADTYIFKSTDTLIKIFNLMKDNMNSFFINNQDNVLFKKYSPKEIIIIASLIEKEGIDNNDKRIISSVILNRLQKNMKLQIDATTIYSITKGKFKLDRKLIIDDLNIEDSYNTYYIKGLPPNPICYVGRKTIEIVLENNKSDYLFYFYDEKLKKHIYSRSYKDHREKLSAYRKKNEK